MRKAALLLCTAVYCTSGQSPWGFRENNQDYRKSEYKGDTSRDVQYNNLYNDPYTNEQVRRERQVSGSQGVDRQDQNVPDFTIPFPTDFSFSEFGSPFGNAQGFQQFLSGLGAGGGVEQGSRFSEQQVPEFQIPNVGQQFGQQSQGLGGSPFKREVDARQLDSYTPSFVPPQPVYNPTKTQPAYPRYNEASRREYSRPQPQQEYQSGYNSRDNQEAKQRYIQEKKPVYRKEYQPVYTPTTQRAKKPDNVEKNDFLSSFDENVFSEENFSFGNSGFEFKKESSKSDSSPPSFNSNPASRDTQVAVEQPQDNLGYFKDDVPTFFNSRPLEQDTPKIYSTPKPKIKDIKKSAFKPPTLVERFNTPIVEPSLPYNQPSKDYQPEPVVTNLYQPEPVVTKVYQPEPVVTNVYQPDQEKVVEKQEFNSFKAEIQERKPEPSTKKPSLQEPKPEHKYEAKNFRAPVQAPQRNNEKHPVIRIKSPERSSSGDRTNPQQNHQYRSNPHQQNHQYRSNPQRQQEYRTVPEQKQEYRTDQKQQQEYRTVQEQQQEYRTVPEQKLEYRTVPEQKQESRTVPEQKHEFRTVPGQNQEFRTVQEQNYKQLPQGELKIVEVLKTPHPIFDVDDFQEIVTASPVQKKFADTNGKEVFDINVTASFKPVASTGVQKRFGPPSPVRGQASPSSKTNKTPALKRNTGERAGDARGLVHLPPLRLPKIKLPFGLSRSTQKSARTEQRKRVQRKYQN